MIARTMRRRGAVRFGGALLGLAVLLGGCASGEPAETPGPAEPRPTASPAPTPSATTGAPIAASLTITLDEGGTSPTETFTLTCDPVGGDHPDPEAACASLVRAGGAAAFAPTPVDVMCTQQWGGPQVARVTGEVDGGRVDATFTRTDGCEISRWDALAPLLGSEGGAA